MPGKPLPKAARGAAAAAAIAAAVALGAPHTERWEGYRGKAYYDPAHIGTQCFGETEHVDPSRIYSRSECATKLRERLSRDYAPTILACVPELADHRAAFAAALDAAYNAGPAAVCASPMARAFRAGRWRQGCDAFPGWYVSARNRKTGVRVVYAGLVARRKDERALCLEGVKP